VTARLISVDWGTTSLRCYLVGRGGAILDRRTSDRGILAVGQDGFEATLLNEIRHWRSSAPELPVVMSGMIGSRQGWHEAAYVPCPAGIQDITANLHSIAVQGCGPIWIVPGVDTRSKTGRPDVMRGEETQIFGALTGLGCTDALFVLPGTHAKWATVVDGRIVGFSTYMTGEVFSALKDHTILGRLMATPPSFDASAFERGVTNSEGTQPGDLLNLVFSARTLPLSGQLGDDEVESYLSGLLIGAEIRAAHTRGRRTADTVHVLGGAALTARYIDACKILGISAKPIDGECVVLGHVAIADAIELPDSS
jgi:2-dehydro-3-deoxygalactonokinase